MLKSGGEIKYLSDSITDVDKLKKSIARLKDKLEWIKEQNESLRNTEEYQTILSMDDWSDYFGELYSELVKERDSLKEEYTKLSSDA